MPKVLTKPKTKVKSKPATPQLTKIEELQAAIDKLKESTQNKLEQVDEYRAKRAVIVVNEPDSKVNRAKLANYDAIINRNLRCIENAPSEIALLEKAIVTEQKRIADSKRSELLAEQRVLSDEIEETSEELVLILEHACRINDKLVNSNARYKVLKSQTGADFLSENVCQGSQQFLKVVHGFNAAELKGERPVRMTCPPPFQFI